jgi:heptosyltransferase-1
VEEAFRELLEGNPLLNSLHPVRARAWRRRPLALRTIREFGAFKQALAQREYDLVFDLEGTLTSGIISRLACAEDRIGLMRDDLRERGNLLFSMRRVPLRRQDCHVTHRCLRLVSVPFARDYQQMELSSAVSTNPEDDLAAEALLATLSDGLVFLFDCGADWQTKLWSEQGWVELGQRVMERFPDAAILLSRESEAERALVAGIAKSIDAARVIDRQSVKGLAALLKRVDLVVGGDTDTVQLAAALGTPTVSFYRASDGRQIGPRGAHHVVIQSPIHCTRCLRTRCDKDLQCRGTIKVEALLAGIESLVGS